MNRVVFRTDASTQIGAGHVTRCATLARVLSQRGNVRSIRPGFGLSPKYLPEILGKRSNVNLERGTALQFKYLSKDKE